MRQVISVSKTRFLPSWRQWKQLPKVLAPGERLSIKIASTFIGVSILALVGTFIFENRIEVPAIGGEYTEGLIGEPQFINPLYASANDVDEDISSLIYSGLLAWDSKNGFVPDLASDYSVNEDGTIYTLKIRDDAYFHDGDSVRARDVLFTINAIQNPAYHSPLAADFAGVSVIQEDDKTVSFILEKPFAPFEQFLTVGIMPANQWADVLPQNTSLAALNLQPIGSGPYRFSEFAKDKKGNILSYTLERNPNYYGQSPFVDTITFKFYSDTTSAVQALEEKYIEGVSLVDFDQLETIRENRNVELVQPLMPRMAVLYLNAKTNQILSDLIVRKAIAQGVDKAALVKALFGESGAQAYSPLLPGMLGYSDEGPNFDRLAANMSLDEAGYSRQSYGKPRLVKEKLAEEIVNDKANTEEKDSELTDKTEDQTEDTEQATEAEIIPAPTLTFTLKTTSSAELEAAAKLIQADLAEIGIGIEIQTISSDVFYSEIIEPRNFEMLLTPVMLGADSDLYAFWHSSQADSGLNIAEYKNDDADTLLEEARTEKDQTIRADKYVQFQKLLATDVPAVFLYQSPYSYAIAKKIRNVNIQNILRPSDRFKDIETWYIKTKKGLK